MILFNLEPFFNPDLGTTTGLVFLMQGFIQPSFMNAQDFTVWSIWYWEVCLPFQMHLSLLHYWFPLFQTHLLTFGCLLVCLLCTFLHVLKVLFFLLSIHSFIAGSSPTSDMRISPLWQPSFLYPLSFWVTHSSLCYSPLWPQSLVQLLERFLSDCAHDMSFIAFYEW